MTNKAQVRKQFGQAANDYATSDVHARGESLDCLLNLANPNVNWDMLDVATGAGHTALAFAPLVSSVVATDITDEMLLKAAELANERGITNLRTIKADAEELPFADASFDFVTCRMAFHHFSRPQKAMAEFARVLKPKGTLGFTDNFTVDDEKGANYYNEYEKLRDPSHHRVCSMAALEAMLSDAGFHVRESTSLTKEFEFHAWADRQRVSEQDKLRLIAMMDRIPETLRPLFNPRKTEDTMYFSLWEAVIIATVS